MLEERANHGDKFSMEKDNDFAKNGRTPRTKKKGGLLTIKKIKNLNLRRSPILAKVFLQSEEIRTQHFYVPGIFAANVLG